MEGIMANPKMTFAKVVFSCARGYVKRLKMDELRELLRARKETPLVLAYAREELRARECDEVPTSPGR